MTMPINFVLVRHGESEGNAAKRLSEQGDHEPITKLKKERHSGSFRLTDCGRKQAIAAGKWISKNLCSEKTGFFDRYCTSEYIRAMETAGLLGLPNARWFVNFYLRERNWGDMDILSEEERWKRFSESLRIKQIEPFFWTPPNGESFADLCLRLDRFLVTIHRECSDMNVVTVCHGEVMWAFRVLLERISQRDFNAIQLGHRPDDRIHNCEIFHYTRRDPETGCLSTHLDWLQRTRILKDSFSNGKAQMPWTKIERKHHGNLDLLTAAESVSRMVS